MHSSEQLTRAFSGYSLGVAVSRISGMARDIVLAFVFGTSPSIALFMIAYRLSNLLRRLLAETPLSSSFIPLYQDLHASDPKKALFFYRDLIIFLSISTTFFVALVGAVGFNLIKLSSLSHRSCEIMKLVVLMFPSLIFIVLYGASSAFLQCHKRFFISSAAPLLFNISWIGAALACAVFSLNNPLQIMALGVVLAFGAQASLTLARSFTMMRPMISFRDLMIIKPQFGQLRGLFKPFIMGTLGVAATQINAALDSLFAHVADPSGPAYLWYAIRIEQLPIALFAVAITAPLLSLLSKPFSDQTQLLKEAFDKMRMLMSLSMFGLLGLSVFGLNLIFGRGEFDYHSLIQTHKALIAYSMGVIPHGLSLIYTSALYAKKIFKTPMRISIYTVVFHVVSNVILVFGFHLGAFSVALSTSLSSLFQMWALRRAFGKHFEIEKTEQKYRHVSIGVISVFFVFIANFSFIKILFIEKRLLSIQEALLACSIGGLSYLFTYTGLEAWLGKGEILKFFRIRYQR